MVTSVALPSVTLKITEDTGPASAVLLGSTTVTMTEEAVVPGQDEVWTAEFHDLSVGQIHNGYTLTATAALEDGSSMSATSAPFDVVAVPPTSGGTPAWPFILAAAAVALLGLVAHLLRCRARTRRTPPRQPPHAVPYPDLGSTDLAPADRDATKTVHIRVEPHSDTGAPHLGGQP